MVGTPCIAHVLSEMDVGNGDRSAAGLTTIGTVLGWTLFAATVLQAVYDGVEAADGKESWAAFTLDIAAMVTFGFGKGVEVAAKGLTGFAEGAAKTVAAGRAGRAALRLKGLPGFLYSLRGVLGPISDGQAFTDARAAAEHAASVIQKAAATAGPGNRTVLLTMSSELGESLARLGALSAGPRCSPDRRPEDHGPGTVDHRRVHPVGVVPGRRGLHPARAGDRGITGMAAAEPAPPREFTVLLPPGWLRIPLDGREQAAAAALATAEVSDLAEPCRSQAREHLLQMIRLAIRHARQAGGIDIMMSLAERDGIPLAASCLGRV